MYGYVTVRRVRVTSVSLEKQQVLKNMNVCLFLP